MRKMLVNVVAVAAVTVGGIAVGTGSAAAAGWEATAIVYSDRGNGGIDVIAARYYSGDTKYKAFVQFQSYGEVWRAENRTTTTAYAYGYVNGTQRFHEKLDPGEVWSDNDSFGENEDVSVKVCVDGGRGCATPRRRQLLTTA